MGAKQLQLNTFKVNLELVPATANDFKEIDYYKDMGYGNQQKAMYKMRLGIPYWLVNSKGELETHPYRTTLETDADAIAYYLKTDRIFIIKNPFK